MKCPKCGAEIPDGSKFCESCGNKVSGSDEVLSKMNNSNVKKPMDKLKLFRYITLGVVGILVIIYLTVLLSTGFKFADRYIGETILFTVISLGLCVPYFLNARKKEKSDSAYHKKKDIIIAICCASVFVVLQIFGSIGAAISSNAENNASYSNAEVQAFIDNWNSAAESNPSGVTNGVKIELSKDDISTNSSDGTEITLSKDIKLILSREGKDLTNLQYQNNNFQLTDSEKFIGETLSFIPNIKQEQINSAFSEFESSIKNKNESGIIGFTFQFESSNNPDEVILQTSCFNTYADTLEKDDNECGLNFGISLDTLCDSYNKAFMDSSQSTLTSSEKEAIINSASDSALFNLSGWGYLPSSSTYSVYPATIVDSDGYGRVILEVEADITTARGIQQHIDYIMAGQLNGNQFDITQGGRQWCFVNQNSSTVNSAIDELKSFINFGVANNTDNSNLESSQFKASTFNNSYILYNFTNSNVMFEILTHNEKVYSVCITSTTGSLYDREDNIIDKVIDACVSNAYQPDTKELVSDNSVYMSGILYQCLGNDVFNITAIDKTKYDTLINNLEEKSYLKYAIQSLNTDSQNNYEQIPSEQLPVPEQTQTPEPASTSEATSEITNPEKVDIDDDKKGEHDTQNSLSEYIGTWVEDISGLNSVEDAKMKGRYILTINDINESNISFTLEKNKENEDIIAKIDVTCPLNQDKRGDFTFDDDGWGNSGSGFISIYNENSLFVQLDMPSDYSSEWAIGAGKPGADFVKVD